MERNSGKTQIKYWIIFSCMGNFSSSDKKSSVIIKIINPVVIVDCYFVYL